MQRFTRCAWWLVAALSWLGGQATVARAYEDQASLGLGVGYAGALSEDALPRHGVVLSSDMSLGLSDIWTLRAPLLVAYHPADRALTRAVFGVELLYLVDVFEWVPYFGAGVDGVAGTYASDMEVDLAVHPVLGLDYLLSRDLVMGLVARSVTILTRRDGVASYFTVALTGALLFDM